MFPLKEHFMDYGSIYKHEEMDLYVHSVNGSFYNDERGKGFDLTELHLTPDISKARKMKDELIKERLTELGFLVVTVLLEKNKE